ncbi:hypothetical protein D6853_09550 [Butyrivibrio sp. X503]|uniref:hypothetical protein n=1 Tax=Butyrivibrio sp. X503 TaxID=2364878 RepID=UPI000EA9BD71|nr:hypothetical protein [Butyrivibrio sp. X503]RKM55780.1 hypothetical protein D6853_09550 [Butyrivibrio sp. X503]
MARDLSFWKENKNTNNSCSETYKNLSNEVYLDYVSELPIEQILNDVSTTFSDWTKLDEKNYEKGDAAIEIFTTKQFCRFDCYSVTEEDMNKIMDIMFKYDCPLYDSAIDVRFA